MDTTVICLVPYHSSRSNDCVLAAASGRFACVETALAAEEWPYDNGDDPSFFVTRREGGLLTWGICRRDVRSKIQEGNVSVFVAFTNVGGVVQYRMSAVATVAGKIDRRLVSRDSRFQGKTYINLLIRPEGNGWTHDESDRHSAQRHPDWPWRISNHASLEKKRFEHRYAEIYKTGYFSDSDLTVAQDYVLFSQEPDETYISPRPPLVAIAQNGEHEKWLSCDLRRLTIDKAAELHHNGRYYMRTKNPVRPHHPLLKF